MLASESEHPVGFKLGSPARGLPPGPARYLEGILNWPLCALRLLDTLYKLFCSAPIGTSVQSSKSSTGLPLKDSLDGVEITRVNVIVHI